MATVGSVSSSYPAWVQNLVNQAMVKERQPLQRLQTYRDTLQVRKGIYQDISSKIDSVLTSITALKGTSNAFEQKAISVKNAIDTTDVTEVSLNGTNAGAGVYDLKVTKLAQSHQLRSAQQAQSNVSLGYAGTFVLGGAIDRSVNGNVGTNNPVAAFNVGTTIRTNEQELGSGDYSVEFRQSGSMWQFRLVDSSGKAVRIDKASDSGTEMTSTWQDFSLVKGKTFDTGRGLTVEFNNADPTTQQLYGNTNIANASYVAKGVEITVKASDSLNDIRATINSKTYAEGNEVQATVVDRRLVLTGARTGANATVKLFDSSYGGTNGSNDGVLAQLGIGVNAAGALTNLSANQLRAAQNAEFSVNNIEMQRSSNKGLTDVVQGLSFDLTATGDATITVSDDGNNIESKVKDLLTNVNGLMSYIKEKTEPKKGASDESGNPTYTPAALGQDWSMRSLRQEIGAGLLQKHSSAIGDAPKYLSQIGVTVGSTGTFELSNSDALASALKSNFQGVKDLFNNLLGSLETRLKTYTNGSQSILQSKQTGLGAEIKQVNSNISQYEKRLQSREASLGDQYSAIYSQLISMSYQSQSIQAISGSTINRSY